MDREKSFHGFDFDQNETFHEDVATELLFSAKLLVPNLDYTLRLR